MRSSTEVLVIGAGPVGLLLACELHRRGVDYLFGYLSGDQTKSDQGAFANLLSIIRQGLDRSAPRWQFFTLRRILSIAR
jgi:glycine/D-amino acid oxidase-like deaminating enzyme